MPADWQTSQLGDVAKVQRGISYVAAQLRPPGRPFVTLKCFERGGGFRSDGLKTYAGVATSEYELAGGELLIANTDLTRDGSVVGAPALAPQFEDELAVFSMDVSRLVTNANRVDNRFLACRLAAYDARAFMQARSGGSTVLHLQLRSVPRYQFQLPPLPEQRHIATILDTLDDAIRKTEQIIAKLKQVKQGLLHDLLTRGIDDNGELRDPERHPEQFKDSELGRIPKEWEVADCERLCREIVVGIVIKPTQYYREAGVPMLRSANVRADGILMEDLKFMSVSDHARMLKSSVGPGDLVTVRTGYPGTTAVIPSHVATANCIDIIISRPGPTILAPYLAIWVNSDQGKGQVLRRQGGLAQQHFNVGDMKELLVALPSVAEQAHLLQSYEQSTRRIKAEECAVGKLQLLKQGLMEDLLTGRVRVTKLLEQAAQ